MRRVAIALRPCERRIVPIQLQVRFQFLIRHMQGDVRNHRGIVKKKRLFLIVPDELKRLRVDAIGRVVGALENVVTSWIALVSPVR